MAMAASRLAFLFFLVGFLLLDFAQSDCDELTGMARSAGISAWLSSSSSSCCNWVGVACSSSSSSSSSAVERISLPSMGLRGSLQTPLRLLNLLHLDLSNNTLSGSIPSLSSPRLHWLDLSSNNFSGSVPAMPASLLHLNLSSNRLTGALPLPPPPSLRILDVSNNAFSGTIPRSPCSPQLLALNISGNRVSGSLPQPLDACAALQAFEAEDNLLDGDIPSAIAAMTSLQTLRLSFNRLRGWVPSQIGALSSLRELWLDRNQLRGTLPASLASCTSLVAFSARENRISGTLAAIAFARLSSLEYLDLSYNALTGAIPPAIANCSRLVTLALTGNTLVGGIPSQLGRLTRLATLMLSKNSLTGEVPHSLASCTSLVALVLTKNSFHGPLLPNLSIDSSPSPFPSLQLLAVGNANITGGVPTWLRNCTRLQVLDLSWNGLSGAVPPWIADLRHLFYLDLSNNTLQGSVPPQLANLAALQAKGDTAAAELRPVSSILFVKHRNNMTRLQYNQVSALPPSILLGSNRLVGGVPAELGRLPRLLCLDLSSNALTGGIPESLGDIRRLESLDLSQNSLSGSIPRSLLKLYALSKLNLSNNRLQGPIPTGFQFFTFTASSFAGNLALCDFPLPKCGNASSVREDSGSGAAPVRRHTRSWIIGMIIGLSVCVAAVGAALWAWILLSRRRAVHHRDDEEEYGSQPSSSFKQVKRRRRGRRWAEAQAEELRRPVEVFHNRELLRQHGLTNADLVKATNGFDPANIVGCGGFGLVFCGVLPDGTKLAIKKLTSDDCLQVEREFEAELETLAMAEHPNLVALQGCSTYGGARLLLYPYMENGSLDSWLHDDRAERRLSWKERLAIARGAAAGLYYLHATCQPHIVHRDIKSSNILLDGGFAAHVADFGLARLMQPTWTHVSTEVVGTLGYIPPEYGAMPVATPRGDVYSFGVVLVELLAGRRPVDACRRYDLVATAQDPRSAAVFPFDEQLRGCGGGVEEVLRIACRCVNPNPVKRPTMEEVVRWLDDVCL